MNLDFSKPPMPPRIHINTTRLFDFAMPHGRLPTRSLAALLLVAGGSFLPRAEAAVTCVSATPSINIIQPWSQSGIEWGVPTNATVNTAIVEYTYTLNKTGTSPEEMGLAAYWMNGGGTWYSVPNAMGFFGGPAGYGASIMMDNGEYAKPGVSAHSTPMTLPTAGRYEMKTRVYFSIKKVADTTAAGVFGVFSSPMAWRPEVKANGTWSTLSTCAASGAGDLHSFALGVGIPPPAPVAPAYCTLNRGQAIAIKLPAVEASAMGGLGTLPTNYQKQEYSLHYACTNTGGVVNPNYRLGLIGTKAGTTNALQSTNPNIGVMVEAVDSRGSAPQTLSPGTTSSASQVRLYDAGQSGGATMKLLGYPVRSGGQSSSDIQPGAFSANGTLRVFTD